MCGTDFSTAWGVPRPEAHGDKEGIYERSHGGRRRPWEEMPPPVAAAWLLPWIAGVLETKNPLHLHTESLPLCGQPQASWGTNREGSGRPGGWADHPLALPDCDPTPGLFPRQEKRGWAEHLQGPFWLDVGWCRRLRAQHGPSCTLCPLPISRAVRAGSFGARAELVSDPRSMGNTMVGQGPASVSLQDWAATWLARC